MGSGVALHCGMRGPVLSSLPERRWVGYRRAYTCAALNFLGSRRLRRGAVGATEPRPRRNVPSLDALHFFERQPVPGAAPRSTRHARARRGGGVPPKALGSHRACVEAPASFPWAAAYSAAEAARSGSTGNQKKNKIYSKHRNVGLLADTVAKLF